MGERSGWRTVGTSGAYPAWLRALVKSSGVYAIRCGGRVLYVGESHKGALKKTIVRHFQSWTRSGSSRHKQSLLGWLFGSSTDPGRTYDRSACEVCVQTCAGWPSPASLNLQAAWIKRLRPRDNIQGADPVPF
jgi:hypothetical protein